MEIRRRDPLVPEIGALERPSLGLKPVQDDYARRVNRSHQRDVSREMEM